MNPLDRCPPVLLLLLLLLLQKLFCCCPIKSVWTLVVVNCGWCCCWFFIEVVVISLLRLLLFVLLLLRLLWVSLFDGVRRFSSTTIGSGADKNTCTASSCGKLLTSIPFTWKKRMEKRKWLVTICWKSLVINSDNLEATHQRANLVGLLTRRPIKIQTFSIKQL